MNKLETQSMEATRIRIVIQILDHAGILNCLVGELALQYYNVPRVVHELEICVPTDAVAKSTSILSSTGLFKPEELNKFDIYSEYKRGVPRLRSTTWIIPSYTVIIFDDASQGLHPLDENIVSKARIEQCEEFSHQIFDHLPANSIVSLPWPRLPPLFEGLCKRYLEHGDDIAMIGAEQLVDGMDLEEDWSKTSLAGTNPEILKLTSNLIAGKESRLDPFSGNTITCFVSNEEESKSLRKIPDIVARGLIDCAACVQFDFDVAKILYSQQRERIVQKRTGIDVTRCGFWTSKAHFRVAPFLHFVRMVNHARLNDAAIALYRVLTRAGIRFGIFGGYAVAAHGGPRESKDIDCLAASYKQQLLQLLDGKEGFVAMNQTRDDYVAFVWSDKPDRSQGVLVEIFPERFTGATHGMQHVGVNAINIAGTQGNTAPSCFLDLFTIFKGKLKAAVSRAKFHDSADLRWLEANFKAYIAPYAGQLNLLIVGLAIQRYPELESAFRRLGVNVEAAKQVASQYDVNRLPPMALGDVQLGLLA